MSSIIDALKKTQSSIDKRPYSDHTIYGDIEIPNTGKQNAQSHASLLSQKKNPGFSTRKFKNPFSFLKRHHVIGSTILLCLCGGIWLGYQYDGQITHEIANARNAITNSFKKHAQTKPVIAVVPTHIKLTLNGTVHVGSNRNAYINNQIYRVGDRVDGYKILEIHYDQVTLLDTLTQKKTVLTTELS